jgi:formylglycine-generating enzyme required for sulfatase activity
MAKKKTTKKTVTRKKAVKKKSVKKSPKKKVTRKKVTKKKPGKKVLTEEIAEQFLADGTSTDPDEFITIEDAAAQSLALMNDQPPESIPNTIGMKLNKIPAGTFMMGSLETERNQEYDEHQHKVTITKPFYMQTTGVTQGQWKAVMGTEPWKGEDYVKEGPNYAATNVNWNDAVAFCKQLSEREGKTYRLPTEAEWEYACRAGTKTKWFFGDDDASLGDYAWWDDCGIIADEEFAHQVGLKKPNPWGLYDMYSGVGEWCGDYFGKDYYKQSPEKDPTGPASADDTDEFVWGGTGFWNTCASRIMKTFLLKGASKEFRQAVDDAVSEHSDDDYRVLRGGGPRCYFYVSSSSRERSLAVYDSYEHHGFRVVRELD